MLTKRIYVLICPVMGAYYAGTEDECEKKEIELMSDHPGEQSPYSIYKASLAIRDNQTSFEQVYNLLMKGSR